MTGDRSVPTDDASPTGSAGAAGKAAAGPPGDALCFTAGYKGGPFAAGVIHAWLAADREAPVVAAGISFGALSAAALQRCYQELEKAAADVRGRKEDLPKEREVRRWRWFRRYLNTLSESPLRALWQAFPDPVDFFSDRPPVRDRSVPEGLSRAEARSRHNYYLLVKLGRWLARLPLSLHTVVEGIVAYVRKKERYGGIAPLRWLAVAAFVARVGLLTLSHLVLSPQWFSQRSFRPPLSGLEQKSRRRRVAHAFGALRFRPLFGWDVWLTAVACLLSLALGALGLAALIIVGGLALTGAWHWVETISSGEYFLPRLVVAIVLSAVFVSVLARRLYYLVWQRPHAARSLGVERGLLHDYHLRRALLTLFADEKGEEPTLAETPMPVLVVAAPLQALPADGKPEEVLSGQQVWAGAGTPLVTALRAALCIPGLLPPLHLSHPDKIRNWISPHRSQGEPLKALDLVDGATVRRNPIPALFSYLRDPRPGQKRRELALRLVSDGEPRLHVVYGVPVEPLPKERQRRAERLDIVDVAFLSSELANRRDTQLEFLQTSFISRLEHEIRCLDPTRATDADPVPIFPDAIAPREEIRFRDALNPSREEILETIAAGCRRTLETLYGDDLRGLPRTGGSVPCHRLLAKISPGRGAFIMPEAPGLPEVCRRCSRELRLPMQRASSSPPAAFAPTFHVAGADGSPDPTRLVEKFRHLSGERPRIVFVASGGVFRGASHIGVLGALHGLDVWPDLIVGASVGALMGGSLGALSILPPDDASRQLARLSETFLHVDLHVALTRELKNAAKQLGVRGRNVELSPRQLRRMILRGSRSDPGFAATGAPPALIDAIAELLLLPHRTTAQIAAQFVAGHYTRAAGRFWNQIKGETLRRLNVRYALMGTSLLEKAAWRLLGGEAGIDLDRDQPFHGEGRRVSFFCTTTDLTSGSAVLLGRDFPDPCHAYDFREASLSSSAFPAVFSPRRASQVFPGLGRTDVLFADGGMFDNLPFVPAMEVMSVIQRAARVSGAISLSAREFLRRRHEQPDLFIAAALDAAPQVRPGERFESLLPIRERSRKLKNNLKIEAFDRSSRLISQQIGRLLTASASNETFERPDFIDSIVHGAVLKVVPTDSEHINPTFAFSAATGLEARRVETAIADGCFQTLKALAEAGHSEGQGSVLQRSVLALREAGRIPEVRRCDKDEKPPPRGACPFFTREGETFDCPFVRAAGFADTPGEVEAIYRVCRRDPQHAPTSRGRG